MVKAAEPEAKIKNGKREKYTHKTGGKTRLNTRVSEIWENYWISKGNGNGAYFRNLLIEHYRELVRYLAERLHRKLPDRVQLDDLISAGVFGLMNAIESYDPSRGVKFETYCSPRVKGSMLDELRSNDWVPRLVRARAHQLEKAANCLKNKLDRNPTEKELAKELSVGVKEFRRLAKESYAPGVVSLSKKLGDDIRAKDYRKLGECGEKAIREIDIIENKKALSPLTDSQKKDLKNILLTGSTRAEKLIIILYYYEEMTMKEIGQAIDLSESRVSQMHSSIIKNLKAKVAKKWGRIETIENFLYKK